MAKSPNWTKDEVDILTENYPILGCGPKMVNLLLGRTSKGINVKASKLGLKVSFNRQWTDSELSILRGYYPCFGTSPELLSKLPNRSADSIRCQAGRLDIVCNTLYGKKKSLEVYQEELSILNITLVGEYTTNRDKTLHMCNVCKHTWSPTPGNLIGGSGCPNCSNKLPFRHTSGCLYLLEIITLSESFLKVGITSRTPLHRVAEITRELDPHLVSIKVLHSKTDTGVRISALEKYILTNPILNKYISTLKFSGCTELFNLSEASNLISIIDNENI